MERETQEWLDKLREIFEYDQDTGKLTYKVKRGLKMPGDLAGQAPHQGYKRIEVSSERWMYHRVCWALHYGKWPDYTIDHINHDCEDNRIENLRDVTQSVNNHNKPRYKTKNKYKGVFNNKSKNKCQARFTQNKKTVSLGYFDTEVEAAKAYDAKAYEVRGPDTYLNFPEDYGLPPHKKVLDESN